MPSLKGLKTWFDYEILITAVVAVIVVALAVLRWGGDRLAEYLERLPLGSTEFTLSLVGFCLAGVLLMIWLAGRSGR